METGSGDDTILGSNATGPINVTTGEGDDEITTGDGDDTVDAGDGDDEVTTGDGADVVDGGDGNNLIDTSGPLNLVDDKNGDGFGFAPYGPFPAVPADTNPNDDMDVVTTGLRRRHDHHRR